MAKVRCRDCGFLAVRNRETRVLEEAEDLVQDTGRGVEKFAAQFYRHESLPVCFMAAINFGVELGGREPEAKDVVRILHHERQCSDFTQWRIGYTAKEHRDAQDRLEERRQRRIETGRFVRSAGWFTILGAILGAILGVVLSGS